MKCTDPTAMSRNERIAELGELLAAGAQRFLARECKSTSQPQNPRDQLDVDGDVEAPCGPSMESAP